jgi:hypothetical protein
MKNPGAPMAWRRGNDRTTQQSIRYRTHCAQHASQPSSALIAFLQAAAERVPLSGSAGGSFVGDLIVPLFGAHGLIEVKARGGGCRQLYAHADRAEPLCVVPSASPSKLRPPPSATRHANTGDIVNEQ